MKREQMTWIILILVQSILLAALWLRVVPTAPPGIAATCPPPPALQVQLPTLDPSILQPNVYRMPVVPTLRGLELQQVARRS